MAQWQEARRQELQAPPQSAFPERPAEAERWVTEQHDNFDTLRRLWEQWLEQHAQFAAERESRPREIETIRAMLCEERDSLAREVKQIQAVLLDERGTLEREPLRPGPAVLHSGLQGVRASRTGAAVPRGGAWRRAHQ